MGSKRRILELLSKLLHTAPKMRGEPLFLRMLGLAVKDVRSVIEIGSSDGCETVQMLRNSEGAQIHLLEPDRENQRRAKENIEREFPRSGRVSYYELAASNREGSGAFYRSRARPNLNSARPTAHATEETTARYVILDRFIERERIEAPLLVKMDIEGHEVEVLDGFRESIKRTDRIHVLMEVHPEAYSEERSLERALEEMFASGFRLVMVESAGTPVPRRFLERGWEPIEVIGSRGLYRGVSPEFVLRYACHPEVDRRADGQGSTKKIIRSLWLEKGSSAEQ